jgi:hypothetical protein
MVYEISRLGRWCGAPTSDTARKKTGRCLRQPIEGSGPGVTPRKKVVKRGVFPLDRSPLIGAFPILPCTCPAQHKRRLTGQGAKRPLTMGATRILVACGGVKTQVFMDVSYTLSRKNLTPEAKASRIWKAPPSASPAVLCAWNGPTRTGTADEASGGETWSSSAGSARSAARAINGMTGTST